MKINISESIEAKLKESEIDTSYFRVRLCEINKRNVIPNSYIEVIFDLPGKINNTGAIDNYQKFIEIIDYIYIDGISLKYSTTYVKDSELRIFFRVKIAVKPARSIEPIEPDEPIEPIEPDEPIEPIEPDEPIEPNEPDEPIEPNEPDEPIEPNEPDEPIEPARSIEPDELDEPKKKTKQKTKKIKEKQEVKYG